MSYQGETKTRHVEQRNEEHINSIHSAIVQINEEIHKYRNKIVYFQNEKKNLELELQEAERLPLVYLSTTLTRYNYGANDEPNLTLIAFWKLIFEFFGLTEKESYKLRTYCRLWKDAIPPLACWTTFPNSLYPTLDLHEYIDRFNQLAENNDPNIVVPQIIMVANGTHEIKVYKDIVNIVNYVKIKFPLTVIGESRTNCVIIGGFKMYGKKKDVIILKDLTAKESYWNGIYGFKGASLVLDNVCIDKAGVHGVRVFQTLRNEIINCEVCHSANHGIFCEDGHITIADINNTKERTRSATSIHHNGTRGRSRDYGLYTTNKSSVIKVNTPLTKEKISFSNKDDRNWGPSFGFN